MRLWFRGAWCTLTDHRHTVRTKENKEEQVRANAAHLLNRGTRVRHGLFDRVGAIAETHDSIRAITPLSHRFYGLILRGDPRRNIDAAAKKQGSGTTDNSK